MTKIFNTLIDSFLANKVGIVPDFLSLELANHLKDNLIELVKNKALQQAGTGNETKLLVRDGIRSDTIYWLDRKHNDQHENAFFDVMDEFILYLNQTCYTGITGCEFHYTLYSKGSFYKKHIDQFQNNDSRQYSMIFYLNVDWKLADGGELCIYHSDYQQKISPTNGKSVFFKSSELAHEVLVTNVPRLSITGWLKR